MVYSAWHKVVQQRRGDMSAQGSGLLGQHSRIWGWQVHRALGTTKCCLLPGTQAGCDAHHAFSLPAQFPTCSTRCPLCPCIWPSIHRRAQLLPCALGRKCPPTTTDSMHTACTLCPHLAQCTPLPPLHYPPSPCTTLPHHPGSRVCSPWLEI